MSFIITDENGNYIDVKLKPANAELFRCNQCDKVKPLHECSWYEHIGHGKHVHVCDDCDDKDYRICHNCGDIITSDDAILGLDDEYYCNSCFDEMYTTCEHCGRTISRDDAEYPDCAHGDAYCSDCYEDIFDECYECGRVHWREDLIWSQRDGEYYCEDCYRNDDVILDYHDMSSNSYERRITDHSKVYYGVEVELDTSYRENANDAAYTLVDSYENIMHLENDGSLDDGFEIISYPFTKEEWLGKKRAWSDIFNICDRNDMEANCNCGLHIHVSRWALPNDKWLALQFFMNIHKKEFISIAGRNEPGYAAFGCDCCDEKCYDSFSRHASNTRYRALNFCSRCNTIEFRMYAPVDCTDDLYGCLAFTWNIVEWLRQTDVTPFMLIETPNKAWKSLIGYIESHDAENMMFINQREEEWRKYHA